jgi:hypothetical protein
MIGITGIRKLAMEVTRTAKYWYRLIGFPSTNYLIGFPSTNYQLPSAIPALIGIGTVPAGIGTAEYILIGITSQLG